MHRSSAVSSIPQEVPLSLGHASSSTPSIRQRCRTTTVFSPTTAAPDPPHGTSAGSNADDLQRQRRRLPATAPLVISPVPCVQAGQSSCTRTGFDGNGRE
ncbi:hypothetical protein K438DRAFT_1836157 [Mycena galopus ATCC 62051]|nr:hypothetical protein K438DRAFT_1836157 [Mycena galopus ATCC 62051]